jgi:hypothetical protein
MAFWSLQRNDFVISPTTHFAATSETIFLVCDTRYDDNVNIFPNELINIIRWASSQWIFGLCVMWKKAFLHTRYSNNWVERKEKWDEWHRVSSLIIAASTTLTDAADFLRVLLFSHKNYLGDFFSWFSLQNFMRSNVIWGFRDWVSGELVEWMNDTTTWTKVLKPK